MKIKVVLPPWMDEKKKRDLFGKAVKLNPTQEEIDRIRKYIREHEIVINLKEDKESDG